MLQKCTILALILLLAGGLTYAWVYSETRAEEDQEQLHTVSPEKYLERYGQWYMLTREEQDQIFREIDEERNSKTPEQLSQEQQARLTADLDRLASGEMRPGDIADFLYGKGWEDQVQLYKQRQEQMEIAQTIGIVCLAIGGVLFGFCLLGWIIRFVAFVLRRRRLRSYAEPEEPEEPAPELTDLESQEQSEMPDEPDLPNVPEIMEERSKPRRKVLTTSEMAASPEAAESPLSERTAVDAFLTNTWAQRNRAECVHPSMPQTEEDSALAVLLTDEQSDQAEWSPEAQWSAQSTFAVPSTSPPVRQPVAQHAAPTHEPVSNPAAENSLKEQADGLQKQIAEFKEMAQTVQQASAAEPLGDTLKELAQQVSAIREYAACQQDRVEKLQDGYDWGIVRTFCLRVIRCVDNIETRIDNLENGEARTHLEDIRDELLFALESSNVEQYRPEINSEFRGQEKLAETMKDREPSPESDLAGKIAKVIRSGYRYMVDDDNYKVVRTAQVKLFG